MSTMSDLWDWCIAHGRGPTVEQMLAAIATVNGLPVPDRHQDPEVAAGDLLKALQQREALRRPKKPGFVAIVRDREGRPKFDSIENIPSVMWTQLSLAEQQDIKDRGGFPEQ